MLPYMGRSTRRAGIVIVAALSAIASAGCGGTTGATPAATPTEASPAGPESGSGSWQARAAAIPGVVNYRQERPEILSRTHRAGPIEYAVLPPPGGPHHHRWMNCQGDVYGDPIPNEHAVHSLEHGAVWVTYHPNLSDRQVEALAQRVEGADYLFMSPFPDLDAPISLQAWGYQLKVRHAADRRIDEFIRALVRNASPDGPGEPCGGGVTVTGTHPVS